MRIKEMPVAIPALANQVGNVGKIAIREVVGIDNVYRKDIDQDYSSDEGFELSFFITRFGVLQKLDSWFPTADAYRRATVRNVPI